jgi:hypothetical protein
MEVQPYRWEAPKNFDDVLARIKAASTNQERLREIFDTLIQDQPLLNYRFGRGSIFWRGRRANSEAGFAHVGELGPPPSAITKAERLNDPRRPVLYASTRIHTVFTELQELHLEEGDYIHLVGIRIKPKTGLHIMAIGELFHIFKTGRSRVLGDKIAAELNRMLNDTDPNLARRLVYVDALLDSYLGDPNARDNEYLHSRAIANAIFRKLERIEAFFYPSVRQESGMNLAIKAETYKEKVHVACSQVVQILRCRELGLYDYETCRHAKRINDDGTFEWLNREEELSNYAVLFGMSKEEAKFCETRNNTLTGNDYLDIVKLPSAPNT